MSYDFKLSESLISNDRLEELKSSAVGICIDAQRSGVEGEICLNAAEAGVILEELIEHRRLQIDQEVLGGERNLRGL